MKNPFGLAAWCCVGVDVVWQGTQWPSQEVGLVEGQARSCPAIHNSTAAATQISMSHTVMYAYPGPPSVPWLAYPGYGWE